MKKIVYLILKANSDAFQTLELIKSYGYNATIMTTESLHHAMDELPEEKHFFNLRELEKSQRNESILCLFMVDDSKLDHLKSVIRESTDSFKKIRGFMYSQNLEDYEGSF